MAYTVYDLAFYFLLYSFLGWCLEVVFCSVNTGKFVNRGFLNGPVCPIYGFGACIVILVLTPIADNLLLLYIGSVVLTSLLELVAGWILKALFKTRWWDYSDQPFNIGGYICLKFSLLWGLAGVLLMKILHPALEGLVSLVPHTLGLVLLAVGYLLLLSDVAVTVSVIAKLNRDLGEITKLAEGLQRGSETMAEGLGNTAISVAQRIEGLDLEGKRQQLTDKLEESRDKLDDIVQATRENIAEALEEHPIRARFDEMMAKRQPLRKRLLKAFPNMRSFKYAEALQQLQERLEAEAAAKKKERQAGKKNKTHKALPEKTETGTEQENSGES